MAPLCWKKMFICEQRDRILTKVAALGQIGLE